MAKRRRNTKKWISRIILVVLLIAAIVVCYFVWDAYFRDKKTDEPAPAQPSQVVAPDNPDQPEQKQTVEPETDEKEKEKTGQYEGENPNKASGITGVITYAGVSGSNLMIRVNIDQYLNGGTCSLGLKKDGNNIYSDTAPIVDSASTSTCEGFNVPVSSISSGKLNIVINITSGDKSGTITGEVTV